MGLSQFRNAELEITGVESVGDNREFVIAGRQVQHVAAAIGEAAPAGLAAAWALQAPVDFAVGAPGVHQDRGGAAQGEGVLDALVGLADGARDVLVQRQRALAQLFGDDPEIEAALGGGVIAEGTLDAEQVFPGAGQGERGGTAVGGARSHGLAKGVRQPPIGIRRGRIQPLNVEALSLAGVEAIQQRRCVRGQDATQRQVNSQHGGHLPRQHAELVVMRLTVATPHCQGVLAGGQGYRVISGEAAVDGAGTGDGPANGVRAGAGALQDIQYQGGRGCQGKGVLIAFVNPGKAARYLVVQDQGLGLPDPLVQAETGTDATRLVVVTLVDQGVGAGRRGRERRRGVVVILAKNHLAVGIDHPPNAITGLPAEDERFAGGGAEAIAEGGIRRRPAYADLLTQREQREVGSVQEPEGIGAGTVLRLDGQGVIPGGQGLNRVAVSGIAGVEINTVGLLTARPGQAPGEVTGGGLSVEHQHAVLGQGEAIDLARAGSGQAIRHHKAQGHRIARRQAGLRNVVDEVELEAVINRSRVADPALHQQGIDPRCGQQESRLIDGEIPGAEHVPAIGVEQTPRRRAAGHR